MSAIIENDIVVEPVSDAIGAEVRGLDLSQPMDVRTASILGDLWNAHLVLLFRNQNLEPRQFVDFSRSFGDLDETPVDKDGKMMVDGIPQLLIISNVEIDGEPLGSLGNLECEWHTDMSYNSKPPKGSGLYALEVPDQGGDTGFLNMELVYETITEDLKAEIIGKRIKHDATHNSAGQRRKDMPYPTDLTKSPGAYHPIIRTHPDTGKKSLFLGRRANAYIEDLSLDASEELLDRLWAHCTQNRFTWHHQWRVGDLVLWDNRAAMHRRDHFEPNTRRHMHRTQISGDKPV